MEFNEILYTAFLTITFIVTFASYRVCSAWCHYNIRVCLH